MVAPRFDSLRPWGLTVSPLGRILRRMATTKPSPTFREWLGPVIESSGLSKREIARRMAVKHPKGVTYETIETGRRTLNKILSGDLSPTQPTRDSIAAALGEKNAPTVEAEEEDDLPAAMLRSLMRDQQLLNKRISRVLKQAERQVVAS